MWWRSSSAERASACSRPAIRSWNVERAFAGWTLGEKDVERKVTPYLVPYDDLPENIKDYDRDTVRNLSRLLTLIQQEPYAFEE